jgi:dihydrofolate reductase
MRLALIAAVAQNGVIGRDNSLPWQLSSDLAYFKRCTLGKPILMGRRTYEAIGRPLPGRTNIVISRARELRIQGAEVVGNLAAALKLGEIAARRDNSGELMVIGGAEIYRLALPLAQRLYLTEVHGEVDGDARFPDWDSGAWIERHREFHHAGEKDSHDFSFVVYDRRDKSA